MRSSITNGWDLVGAKIKTGVDQGDLFGVEEDLPPKRKPQVIVRPENLIEIPEPLEGEKEEIDLTDLDELVVDVKGYEDWPAVLDSFEYGPGVEISHVEIAGVESKDLFRSDFTEIKNAPALRAAGLTGAKLSQTELADLLKSTMRDIASALLAEEGIGSHELGYFYGVLMDHVRSKLLGGSTVGSASEELLTQALRHRHTIITNFKQRLGLVSSVVNHKKEVAHAGN